MKANPDKFQAICVGKKAHGNIESFQIGQTNITRKENATLLGINIEKNVYPCTPSPVHPSFTI